MDPVPIFQLVPLTEHYGKALCSWVYPAPYDIYNWPAWEAMAADRQEFADPVIRDAQYRAVLDQEGTLWGFAQLFPIVGVTRLGLGMRPDLCGRGYGVSFVRAVVETAKQKAPANEIDLEVLTWNERAYRVYEKAGFGLTDTYERMTPHGMAEFHCMVWNP